MNRIWPILLLLLAVSAPAQPTSREFQLFKVRVEEYMAAAGLAQTNQQTQLNTLSSCCAGGGGSGSLTIKTNSVTVGLLTFSTPASINISTNGVVFGHL